MKEYIILAIDDNGDNVGGCRTMSETLAQNRVKYYNSRGLFAVKLVREIGPGKRGEE